MNGCVIRKPWLIVWMLCLLGVALSASADGEDLVSVAVEGIEGNLLANVKALLEINKLDGKPAPVESRLRWLHNRAEDDIRRALQPFGYYQPTITADLEKRDKGWRARYRIDPGPPLHINELDVKVLGEGAQDPAFQKILAELPLAKGQVLNQTRYEELKQNLQWQATEHGYFDARLVVSELQVDLATNTAAVRLHIDTGKRYRFGQINWPSDALVPEFLRRYLNFKSGDPYDANNLLSLQSDLINSEYFDQVGVDAPLDQAQDRNVPVNVQLKMRKSRKYTFGLGYGTDTGVRGKAGIEGRWFNRWGHRYKVELQASQIGYKLGAEYTIPGADPRTDALAYRTTLSSEKIDTTESQTALIGINRKRQSGRWLTVMALDFQRETFSFNGGPAETTNLLIPSLVVSRVSVDDRVYVPAGNRISLELRGAQQALLSDLSFVQVVARGKWIFPFGRGRFITRADVGTTYTTDFDRLPATLRFYAGGDNSVRGYSLNTISPRDADDKVVGGKKLVVGSVEYEYPVWDKWSIAAFADSGDAFDAGTPKFKTGVGFGVRWLSPVGPVRVDLASGLDQPPGDTIRLHLSIGPDL